MAPGKTSTEPPMKRQRTIVKENHYAHINAAQHARYTGDALTTPALAGALDLLLKSRQPSDLDRNRIEISLNTVKASLDTLKKKTISLDSPVTRSTLRRVAPGVSPHSFFRGDRSHMLSLLCKPPVRVNVVGSFLLGYSSDLVADVAVEMPSHLFPQKEKDHLNYRYHDKRMFYLIYLARHFAKIEQHKWCNVSLTNKCLNGDGLKPVLSVSHIDHQHITICIIPSYAPGVFNEERLSDNYRNVRPPKVTSVVSDSNMATVGYNSSIALDSTFLESLQVLHAATRGVPAFSDTILLLDLWCIRHRLLPGKPVLAALLADIINKGAAPRRASRDQLLRVALNSIRGGCLKTLKLGRIWPCGSLDPALLERCQRSAAAALHVMESKTAADDPWFGILPFLFSTARGIEAAPRPLSTLFDGFLRICVEQDAVVPSEQELTFVLQRTLIDTQRVLSMERLRTDLFGLMLKSEDDVRRKVDTCNDDGDGGRELFKAFWGEKAGLRRFKDGRIVESLVWEGGVNTLNEMCAFTFGKYFSNRVTVKVVVLEIEKAAGIQGRDEAAHRAITAFDELATLLRSLEGLPLSIRAVHATSPQLRRCGANLIRPKQSSRFIEALDIVASFESSGAWPDDPVAIAAAKAAFYVALKSSLAAKGLESKATISFLEIVLAGFVFRLRIRVDKERRLLSEGSEDVDALVWETEKRVRHHDNIKHIGNPLMGNVTRIAKRWLDRHLLLSQMGTRADELVEVLVAFVMSRGEVSERKSTMGYFCQFLHLLCEFPWEACPLALLLRGSEQVGVTGPNNANIAEELGQFLLCAQQRYIEQKDGKPAFMVYTAWNEDHDDVETWFPRAHCPEQAVARRVCAAARSALAFIESYVTGEDGAGGSLQTTFEPALCEYDVVLELQCGVLDGRGARIAGLNPVMRLRYELERRLGTFALFLAERGRGNVICVVWRPAAFADVKFVLRDAPFRTPDEEARSLKPSREEMVAEMQLIGRGLVVGVRFPKEGESGGTE